ncbi:MAG: TSUP family transporter [bacterium]
MDYLIICLVAAFASGLTFFSGFGLGTLLLPAFALFFPIEVAIALTAIVHFLNNLFKLYLVGKHANRVIVLRFGLPAILAAFLGAWLLLALSGMQDLLSYAIANQVYQVSLVNLVIAVLMIGFAVVEVMPFFDKLAFGQKSLPIGGMLSGFFGGLSGHQGALRSAFLVKCGLTKESFIGTGVMIACLIDFTRLIVYSSRYSFTATSESTGLLVAVTLSAFLGAFIGKRLLKKITLHAVRAIVAVMLFGVAIGLGLGLI